VRRFELRLERLLTMRLVSHFGVFGVCVVEEKWRTTT
jgi:hypothetical protein